jgi:hypothetical protein
LNLRPPGYEPGELPDCSTPRRERQYTTVQAVFWAALGFLVVATVAGAAYVGVRAWRAWQAFVSLAVVGAAGLDLLMLRSDELTAKTERAATKAEQLLTAAERLEGSLVRARILVDATGEARDLLNAVRAFAPRK